MGRIVLGAFLLAACEAAAPARVPDVRWPPAPEAARIRLTQVFTDPRDLGILPAWYSRLWRFIAGEDEGNTLVLPAAVAFHNNMLAISDVQAASVLILDQVEGTIVKVESLGRTPLRSPVGLAFDARGLWISDSETNLVAQVDLEGKLLRVIPDLERPAGLAVAVDGRLAIAQPAAHRVTVLFQDGRRVDLGDAGDGAGQFNFPTQVAFGADGSLYVNDALNFRIQHFDPGLTFAGMFGRRGDGPGWFGRARGLAVDEAGRVYVADALFDVVQVFDAAGQLLLVIGSGGSAPGEFWMPFGLFYEKGRLAVVDAENARVQFFTILSEGAL